MIEIKANLWEFTADARFVTTNGVIKRNGDLVMGAGVAKQAAILHPKLPSILGDHVAENGNTCFFAEKEKIISFPTKNHWTDKSSIDLIIRSAQRISEIADEFNLKIIAGTRPGCGLGGLDWDYVKKHISGLLDDRFVICQPGLTG